MRATMRTSSTTPVPAPAATSSSLANFHPPLLQRRCSCGGSGEGPGECEECRRRAALQRSPTGADGPAIAPPIVHDVLRSPGRPLASGVRARMESHFGHDFSRVRVHTDPKAADSARAVGAEAYTVGSRIAFGEGRYRPGSPAGDHLLAHELAHVVQQGGDAQSVAPPREIPVSPARDSLEAAANAMAQGTPQRRLEGAETRLWAPSLQRRLVDGGRDQRDQFGGSTLPYREATELAECIRVLGERSTEYCRQEVLGEEPQRAPSSGTEPSIEILGVDLDSGTDLRLGPAGSTGTLSLVLVGAGGNHLIASGERAAGAVTEQFNVSGLPTREFNEVRATWNVDGARAMDTRPFSIDVLGLFRHSQYNIPHEDQCQGAPVPAYVTDAACNGTPTTHRKFFSQVKLNGSGVSIDHGNLTREAFCLRQSGAPADAQGRSFRIVQDFHGGCGSNTTLDNSTVAACRGRAELPCGSRIFIDTQGTKTVTDFCPACCGHDQLDNFTTDPACAGIVDLGSFMTVRLP